MFAQPCIQCRAQCDVGNFDVIDRIHHEAFRVTVHGELTTGDPLPDRIYEIEASDEQYARMACLERYAHEMTRLN